MRDLMEALKRVRSNRGAPGVDGMTVEALSPYLKEHWTRIREELLGETYIPQPIRRVEIPKPDGEGDTPAGHPDGSGPVDPTVDPAGTDPVFDPHFSESGYGFRPGRGATTRSWRPDPTWKPDIALWWIWIWRSSSTV